MSDVPRPAAPGGMGVRAAGIRAAHGGTEVLHEVSLEIAPGSVLAILGPSGSGKSTFVRALAGLHPLVAGRVEIGGRDVTDAPPEHRGVGLVPQDGALFATRTAAANVAYGLRGVRARGASAHPRVRELLETVGLAGLGDRMPHELSGGQQQRVAVARALAREPALVLLDEPFNALDAGLRERVRADVIDVVRASGTTAVLVTHDREEALSLADAVAVLRDGALVQAGPPRTLYREPVDAWTARFVADANLLDGRREGGEVVTALGRAAATVGAGVGAGAVTAVVRPEQLRLAPAGASARVVRVAFRGADVRAELELDGGVGIVARLDDADELRGGERVHIRAVGPVHVVAAVRSIDAEPIHMLQAAQT